MFLLHDGKFVAISRMEAEQKHFNANSANTCTNSGLIGVN